MIIHHQNNVAAFAGNHVVYWVGQPLFQWRISITSGAAGVDLIAQARSISRLVFSRTWGRVN
jgi:hypothetical protein